MCIHICHSALATQRREAWLATHSLLAESSLLLSEWAGILSCTNGPFQGLTSSSGATIAIRKLPARLHTQQARTVV
jgi:hypothetical protein